MSLAAMQVSCDPSCKVSRLWMRIEDEKGLCSVTSIA